MTTLHDSIRADLSDILWGRTAFVIWTLRTDTSRYVQATRDRFRLLGEVVGARHRAEPWTEEQYGALYSLGWSAPVEPHGNHEQRWWPWSIGRATDGLAAAMMTVFGAVSLHDLVVERCDDDDGPAGWVRSTP